MSAIEVTPSRKPVTESVGIKKVRGGFIVTYYDKARPTQAIFDTGGERVELVASTIDAAFSLVTELLDPDGVRPS